MLSDNVLMLSVLVDLFCPAIALFNGIAKYFLCSMMTMDQQLYIHCNENLIYVFSEKELRGLSPNFHIHVSVSDL
jgi:hypothetical protein